MNGINDMKIKELFAELMQSRVSWKISALGDSVRIAIDSPAC